MLVSSVAAVLTVSLHISFTTNIPLRSVAVTGIRESDWIGDNRPDKVIKTAAVKNQSTFKFEIDENTDSAWFTLDIAYIDGTEDVFSLDMKQVATGDISDYYKLDSNDHKIRFQPKSQSLNVEIEIIDV